MKSPKRKNFHFEKMNNCLYDTDHEDSMETETSSGSLQFNVQSTPPPKRMHCQNDIVSHRLSFHTFPEALPNVQDVVCPDNIHVGTCYPDNGKKSLAVKEEDYGRRLPLESASLIAESSKIVPENSNLEFGSADLNTSLEFGASTPAKAKRNLNTSLLAVDGGLNSPPSGRLHTSLDFGDSPEERFEHSHEDSPLGKSHGSPLFSPSVHSFPNYSPLQAENKTFVSIDAESPYWTDTSYSSSLCQQRMMPDQSVFDTSVCSSRKSTPQRSPLVCPPTPVRQPNWVHDNHGKLTRSSSLSASKVLLTLPNCPKVERKKLRDMEECPQLFEDFVNMGWIGCGAFAEVFKMRSVEDGLVYAIKKSKQQFRSKRDRTRLLREVRIYEKLANASKESCHNIMQYYRAWQEDGYFYIQTELCAYGNVKDFMDSLPEPVGIPEVSIWCVVRDISSALAFIHKAKIVHLDIKPQNIFIAQHGVLKIGDFGMAVEENTHDDDAEGDILYMAKELLTDSYVQASADIFSFGMMLLELTTNISLPQDGDFWHDLRNGNSPSIGKAYSRKLDELIKQMLHPNASMRPTAVQILQHVQDYKSVNHFIAQRSHHLTSNAVLRPTLFDELGQH